MIPGMDGWTILAALKADPTVADIPVIILSIVDEKNLGYALGAALYPIERQLVRHRAESASSELMVCRRIAA